MANYNFSEIEKKWQDKWEEEKSFRAVDFHPTKPKFYVLYEFYNISGNLHMGHLKGTIPADALARYKRLKGYNVLFPIGGDAFGLPAENAAIKHGINPEDFVSNGMTNVMEQSKRLGLSFDFDRQICTSEPKYFKWTQWIFKELFKHNKAYKKKGVVNFCKTCQTVLSNEDSQGGVCDRCGNAVIQEERWVWFLKMKEYSEKLLNNVDNIVMAENLKEAQRNWIGKSEGMQVKFNLVDKNSNIIEQMEVFTTCIETIYGVTYVVIAPENKLIDKMQNSITNFNEAVEYRKQTALRSEFERIAEQKEKTGCKLEGIFAINPMNNAKVPVYIADFVLNNYGTGAVMAVPCHDQRDYEFAKRYNIPMLQVISGDCTNQAVEKGEYMVNDAIMLNSAEFNNLPVKDAKQKMAQKIVELNAGTKQINYKMQDWSFNRQRYWGEPFPIIFCDKCGTVALNDSDLPLTLPRTNDYLPNAKGDSPLSKIDNWVNCKCPKCGGSAKRETDTMPNWAGSSWYWLRYVDPYNSKKLADYDKLKYWGSVDCYTGGTEHITRHVLYAFFWQNFLFEIGAVPTRDPFIKKMGSGLVLDDEGKKMSKSSANGLSPLEVIKDYGTDAARLHLHFLCGYEDSAMWTYKGIEGITNFLNRVWNLQDIIKGEQASTEHETELNKLIKKVGEDLENLKLNTAIASCMTFMKRIREDGFITKEELRQFLIVLNPLAPHITSEIYEIVFGKNIIDETYPDYDDSKMIESQIELPVQINGKLKGTILVNKDAEQSEVVEQIKTLNKYNIDPNLAKKIIFVPNKIINFIV